jgi:hypothetical protein
MRGVRRTAAADGVRAVRTAPATAERVVAMVAHCPPTLTGLRDWALLLLGFAGAADDGVRGDDPPHAAAPHRACRLMAIFVLRPHSGDVRLPGEYCRTCQSETLPVDPSAPGRSST